ncbi:hypothetical protein [Microbacterium arborescens]|uniref:hypothetical protein n=1 Tax=Microbacterium arborescens TaxID=33883 RepID=UPI0025A06E3B|nr:hypothetical protein [Microbacterium arborescens]WJM15397.1 hypothetical protein QUC20_14125 [Microbacterium arborescens]
MTRSRIAPMAVALVSATLLLAACDAQPGADRPDGSSPVSSAPATPAPTATSSVEDEPGETVRGSGYSFTVPRGWAVPDQDPTGGQVDVFVSESADAEGRYITVVVSPGVITPGDVEADGAASLEAVGATDVSLEDRVDIAGSESAHLVATLEQGGAPTLIDQYYATRDEQTFVITIASPADTAEEDRRRLAEIVLSSWAWE